MYKDEDGDLVRKCYLNNHEKLKEDNIEIEVGPADDDIYIEIRSNNTKDDSFVNICLSKDQLKYLNAFITAYLNG